VVEERTNVLLQVRILGSSEYSSFRMMMHVGSVSNSNLLRQICYVILVPEKPLSPASLTDCGANSGHGCQAPGSSFSNFKRLLCANVVTVITLLVLYIQQVTQSIVNPSMPVLQAKTPEASRFRPQAEEDIFSPRSAAAVALSSISRRGTTDSSQSSTPSTSGSETGSPPDAPNSHETDRSSAASSGPPSVMHRPSPGYGGPSPAYHAPFSAIKQGYWPPPPPHFFPTHGSGVKPYSTVCQQRPVVRLLPLETTSLTFVLQYPQNHYYPPPPHHYQPPMSQPYPMQTRSRPVEEVHPHITPTPKKLKTDESASVEGPKDYNRKTKSLSMLSETFVKLFANTPRGSPVYIDCLARDLCVERRRIYDVVNILESVRIVTKQAKNSYQWMGMEHLPCMFALLQHDAVFDHPDAALKYKIADEVPSEKEIHAARANSDRQDNKSLARLSQLFLRVFLVGFPSLTLPEASDLIHGTKTSMEELAFIGSKNNPDGVPLDPHKFQKAASRGLKTKIRRLYDIANVFTALGIMRKDEEKTNPFFLESRRPRFAWGYTITPKELAKIYRDLPLQVQLERNPFQCVVVREEKVLITQNSAQKEKKEDPIANIHVTGGAVTETLPLAKATNNKSYYV